MRDQPGEPLGPGRLWCDDTVGAGFLPNGIAQSDVKGDGNAVLPAPGDWRSVLLDQYSYDNNVDVNVELFEAPDEAQEMGRRGRLAVERRYHHEADLVQLEALYAELAGTR